MNLSETSNDSVQSDAMVCYCYRLTVSKLNKLYSELGSVAAVEEATRVGLGCGGCRAIIHSMFNEAPSDINRLDVKPISGTSCVKPGSRIMKGFVISDDQFESSIFSSNAVAPQLGACDSTANIEYTLLNQYGLPVLNNSLKIKTNETFKFHTENLNLPKPFYGMFIYTLDRANFGSSRFNIYWKAKNSITSTHENSSTGRPRIRIPAIFDNGFIKSGTEIYLALMNPHYKKIDFKVEIHSVDFENSIVWNTSLKAYNTTWINASNKFLIPFLNRYPGSTAIIKIETEEMELHEAITTYFFTYNKMADAWNCNHL